MNTHNVGKKGEAIAANFLKRKGFHILEQNYRNPEGEIDIIAQREGMLCFIEVKFRSSDIYGNALEAITLSKQKRIIKSASLYIADNKIYTTPAQFCVISIQRNGKSLSINLIENAFQSNSN